MFGEHIFIPDLYFPSFHLKVKTAAVTAVSSNAEWQLTGNMQN